MLPAAVKEPLVAHLEHVRQRHQHDLAQGFGRVYVPDALQRTYPHVSSEWGRQWVFPASQISLDPRSGEHRRHHRHESVLQRAVKEGGQNHTADQDGQLPYTAALVRHTPVGRWL